MSAALIVYVSTLYGTAFLAFAALGLWITREIRAGHEDTKQEIRLVRAQTLDFLQDVRRDQLENRRLAHEQREATSRLIQEGDRHTQSMLDDIRQVQQDIAVLIRMLIEKQDESGS